MTTRQPLTAVNGVPTELQAGDSLATPFDWNSFCGGAPGASWVLGRWSSISTALKIVQSLCSALAGTAFSAAWTATLYATPPGGSKTSIGTVAFAANATVGTVSINTAAVAAGSVLEIDAPSSADSTGADVNINIAGLRQ